VERAFGMLKLLAWGCRIFSGRINGAMAGV